MKILPLLFGLALVHFGSTANAHAHLQNSSPAENSVITTSPTNLVLNFSEVARLTALSLQKGMPLLRPNTDGPRRMADALSVVLRALSFVLLFQAAGLAIFVTLFGDRLAILQDPIRRGGQVVAPTAQH
jgi:hypothetical protein